MTVLIKSMGCVTAVAIVPAKTDNPSISMKLGYQYRLYEARDESINILNDKD